MDQPLDDDESRDAFFRRVFDEVIRPQLRQLAEQMGGVDPEDLEQAEIDITQLGFDPESLPVDLQAASGEALLLGGHDAERVQAVMQLVQEHLREGLSLSYIMHELTDVPIAGISSSQIGNIRVNMVAIDPRPREDDVAVPSADELRAMFER